MRLRIRLWLFSFFFLVAGYEGSLSQTAYSSPSEYIAEVPNVGFLTLKLHNPQQDSGQADLGWLGVELRACWERQGERVLIYDLGTYTAKKPAELAFVLVRLDDESLAFTGGGLITNSRMELFQSVVWFPKKSELAYGKESQNQAERSLRIRLNHGVQQQRKKLFDHGSLKPLPATFPTSFMDVMALLCWDRTNELAAILQHPALSGDVLDTVGSSLVDSGATAGFVLPVLGAHRNLSRNLQERLFNLPKDAATWRAVARNPSADKSYYPEYLRRIREGDRQVRFSVARDRLAPKEAWELALAPKEPYVLDEFTRNRNAPPVLLDSIAAESTLRDPRGLASNPATPPAVLDRLSSSTDKQVLWALQKNPSLSPSGLDRVLRTLATTPQENYRDTVASDSRLPPDLILKLSQDVSIQVRIVLAMNPSVPLEVLEKLARDPYAMVSERARDNIKQHFPQAHEQTVGSWIPLDQLNPHSNLSEDITEAIKAGDLTKVRLLLAISDDPEITPSYSTVVTMILRENFDGCKDFLPEAISKGGAAANESLATSRELKPAHIKWLVDNELLSEPFVERLVIVATQEGRGDVIKACKEHALLRELPQVVKDGALLTATALRRTELVDFWLSEGASPDHPVRFNESAVDVAAKMYSIDLLKRLDSHRKYASLIAEVAKEFPPAPRSRFLGHWSNKKSEFSTVAFMLNPDGTGYMGASITSFPVLWTQTGEDSLTLVIVGPQGPVKDKPINLRYVQPRDLLRIESAGDKAMFVPNDQAGPFYRLAAAPNSGSPGY